jgi:hypothetical protein
MNKFYLIYTVDDSKLSNSSFFYRKKNPNENFIKKIQDRHLSKIK